jgi:hypothetical protein
MCGSKIYDRQIKDILVADVEEQSMLAAKIGAKAKDRIRRIQIRARADEETVRLVHK